jgi:hypothetical protein
MNLNLRQWLISSGFFGLGMFSVQFFSMLANILCKTKELLKIVSIMNLALFVLKFLGYNIVGVSLIYKVSGDDLINCNVSLQSYMEAIFIILIIAWLCLLLFLCKIYE